MAIEAPEDPQELRAASATSRESGEADGLGRWYFRGGSCFYERATNLETHVTKQRKLSQNK